MTQTTTTTSTNPLLLTGEAPRFDLFEPAHVAPGITELIETAERRLQDVEAAVEPTWEGAMQSVHELTWPVEYGWGIVSHLMGVRNSDELREAHGQMQPKVVEFFTRLGQSEALFGALDGLRNGDGWSALDETQQRVVEKSLLDMQLSGIGLKGEEREQFNTNVKEQAELSTAFSNAVLDSTKAFELVITDPTQVEGLPDSLLRATAQSAATNGHEGATAEAGPWRVTLDFPVFGPFMQHSRRRDLREQVYRAFITRASSADHDNTPRIQRILELRRDQAQLLGYGSYAEVSLATKMAGAVPDVDRLLGELRDAARPAALKDHEELTEFARDASGTADLELLHWDVPFWSERQREKLYDFTDEGLRPFFPFPNVLDGLFALVGRFLGIAVEAVDGEVPVWHPDVRYFRVLDGDGSPLAHFYLDPYSRPADKRGGAWMNSFIGREKRADGTVQRPVAVLVCNQTAPVGETPSLMTFREVETLFHEFGHSLQHMLTEVDHPQAAGIANVEWDAVELPSQFMENWCYHHPTLMGLARHYESGDQLPDDLFEKLKSARNYRSGSMTMRQVYFAHMDMELHHRHVPGGDESLADVKARVVAESTVIPPLPEDRFECAFAHIFAGGYAAGYYSYKWAEVLSADAFAAFEEAGLDDEAAIAETGRRYRGTVLALGGSRHPMEVFRAFRGREPTTAALLRHTGLA